MDGPNQPEDETSSPLTGEEIVAFVIEQANAGVDRGSIKRMLTDKGMDSAEAWTSVDEILAAADQERLTRETLVPAVAGGGLAAIVAGVIWGVIVNVTGYEIGFAAVGVGFLAGTAVVMFTRGKKGPQLQIVAALASVLGILIGKYLIYVFTVRAALEREFGADTFEVPIFSLETIRFFFEDISIWFSGFDILWLGLAVITAWGIPRGIGLKVRSTEVP